MKLIEKASLYLMGRQMFDVTEMQRFLYNNGIPGDRVTHLTVEDESLDGSQKLVETAGRVCYMSFEKPRPGGNEAYITHVMEVGHGSVLEHAVYNVLVEGISRSLSHELVRHRAGFGYSQLSQRYVDESVAEYVIPKRIAEDPLLKEEWVKDIQYAHDAYTKLVAKLLPANIESLSGEEKTAARKEARQAARSLLPNATETKIFVTGNARAFRHFIELRGTKHADTEIRALAVQLYYLLEEQSPAIFGDMTVDDNGCVTAKYHKV